MPTSQSVEQPLGRFPTLFCRVKGRNGVVREYRALVVPTAEFCVIPVGDAYELGYSEVVPSDARIPLPNTVGFATYTGYGRGTAIKMAQVGVGGMSFKDVEFLAYDLLQTLGFNLIMGQSLLRQTRLDIDFNSGRLRMEKVIRDQ